MKLKHLLSFIIAIITLTSCEFTETIEINKDGSGTLSIGVDASELMSMMGEEAQNNEESIDTIINFKDILEEEKDSIAQLPQNEQEALKSLEDFTMHMVMNESNMSFDLKTDFVAVDSLNNVLDHLKNAQDINGNQGMPANSPMDGIFKNSNNIDISYAFTKKKFVRKVTIIDQEKFDKEKETISQEVSLLSGSVYRLKYVFPKKIKSVSVENAMISQDQKTVIIEYTLGDYITDPEKMNLEVKF